MTYQAAGIFGEFLKGYAQGANQAHQQRMEQVRQLQDMSIRFAERAENDPDPDVAQMFKQRSHDLMDESEKIRTKKTGLWNLVSKLISPQGKGDKKAGGLSDMLATTRDQDAGVAGAQGTAPGATPEAPPQGSVMNVAQQYPTGPLPPTTVEGGKFVTPPPPQAQPPQIPTGQTTVQGGQFTTQQGQAQAPGAFPASQFQLRNTPPAPAASVAPAVSAKAAPTSMADMSGLSAAQRAQYKLNTLTADYQTAKQTGSQIDIMNARIKAESAAAESARAATEVYMETRAGEFVASPEGQQMKIDDPEYHREVSFFLRYGKDIINRPDRFLNIEGRDQATGQKYAVMWDPTRKQEVGPRKELAPSADEREAQALIGTIGPDGKPVQSWDQAKSIADINYLKDLKVKRVLADDSVRNAQLLAQGREQRLADRKAAAGGTLTPKDADRIMAEAYRYADQLVPTQPDPNDPTRRIRDGRAIDGYAALYIENEIGVPVATIQTLRRRGSPEITPQEKGSNYLDRKSGTGPGGPGGAPPAAITPRTIPR